MRTIALSSEDGNHKLWKCGVCGRHYQDEAITDTCCKCDECGEVVEFTGAFQSRHRECESKRHSRRCAERLAAAEEVPYEGGFVYSDEVSGYHDGYFCEMDDLLEYCECEEVDLPEFVFACTPTKHAMDLESILEDVCSDGPEDMADQFDIPDELEQGIRLFNAQNATALTTYYEDHERKYRVNP